MTEESHLFNFELASAGAGLDLLIEQAEWEEPSAGGFYGWVEEQGVTVNFSNLFSLLDMYQSNCDSDGDIVADLRVYRSSDFNYNFVASYGRLSSTRVVNNEHSSESITVELGESISIPFGEIETAEWEGGVYREDGSLFFLHPTIVINDDDTDINYRKVATWEGIVVGTIRVSIVRSYHAYTLTIDPRDATAAEQEAESFELASLYESRVMAFYSGGYKVHDVTLPDMNDSVCEGGGSIIIDPDEDPVTYEISVTAFDYCSGDDLTDVDIWIDGVSVVEWPLTLEEGEHTILVRKSGYTDTDQDDLTENDTFTL